MEIPRKLLKEEIEKWIESEEGKRVYLCLHGIDLLRHGFDEGFRGGLSSQYYVDEDVAKKSPEEQFEWLKEQMPIKEIYHATYIPETDRLILSDKDEWLLERGCLENKLEKEDFARKGYHYLIGTIATIKSNGWKIFDLLYGGYRLEGKTVQLSKEGLAKKGYILLVRSRERKHPTEGKYIPILPS